jgi:phage-related protein
MAAVVLSIIGKYDDKAISKAQSELAKLGGAAKKNSKLVGAIGGAAKVAGVAALGAAVGFGAFAVQGIAAAEEAATAQARLDQVAQSMGFVGGAYAGATDRLKDYASELSKQIAVEDETILSVQAKLATFKEVGSTMDEAGGAMDRATQAAFDLAATGFGSAETNAVQLGKALQDPVKGISALSRAGVTFTEVEKDKIKALVESGNAAEAQEMILGALETQVGGVAEATANASDKMKVGFNELQEQVGTALLPTFEKIVDTLLPIMESLQEPLAQVAEIVGGVLSEAFDAIAPVIPILAKAFADVAGIVAGALGTALSALIPVLTPVLETFADLVNKIGPLLQPLLDKVAGLLANILSAVVPLIAPLTELVFAILEALAPILDIVVDVLMILVDALKPIINAVLPLLPALSDLAKLFGKVLTPILEALTPVIEILANILSDVLVRAVGLILTALGYLIIGFSKLAPFVLENVTKPIVSAFLTMAENVVGAAANMLGWVPGLGDKLNEAKDAIGTFKTNAEKAISGAADTIGKEGAKIGQELVDQGVNSMTNPEAVKKTKNAGIKMGKNLAGGVITGLENTQLDVNSTSANMVQGAIDAANKTAGIKSPSTVFAEMGRMLTAGLVQGVKEGGDDVRKTLSETFLESFRQTKDKLKQELKDAKAAFNDFASSVSGAITSAINFGAANEMTTVNAAGETVGMTFMEGLRAQAAQAVQFASKVKELVSLNLSEAALTKVLEAGAVAGTSIANELIAGGATAITETNELVSSTQAAADEVGAMAANNFYGAGVSSAQSTYDGFKANFGKGGPARKAMETLMDNLAASLNRSSTITVTTVNKIITENVPGLPGRAAGGPVSASTAYVVGERGPEIFVPNMSGNIIPNDKLGSISGRGSYGAAASSTTGATINLTINAGMGANGSEIGREIVEQIKRYERVAGNVFASA